ncbi:MAG: hypothetical protein KZQ77_05375, partial [Candidatus Thiodiazotropha sp. (ex Notomyrtea botanica)]|nr:hypothetical protein [Candidatus Thiodiazotropha sp. (ex Notomyrtea botanica)]
MGWRTALWAVIDIIRNQLTTVETVHLHITPLALTGPKEISPKNPSNLFSGRLYPVETGYIFGQC